MKLADLITASRIILVGPITIALLLERSDVALVLYSLAVVSDWLDGYAARKYGSSPGGAWFDAVADICFAVALIAWGYWKLPHHRDLIHLYAPILLTVAGGFAFASHRRVGRVLLLHLWTGKATGLAGVLWFGLSYFAGAGRWTAHVAWVVAITFYLECLVYVLRGRTDLHGRSAFGRERRSS